MAFIDEMRDKAKKLQRNLVLPEGTEPRTVQAARIILDESLAASVTLIGKTDAVEAVAKEQKVSLDGVTVVDPAASPDLEDFAKGYHELRKHKGLDETTARQEIIEPLKWGAMMVHTGIAYAIIAGA